MDIANILQCPRTGNKLLFGSAGSIVHVEHSDVIYPVIDGIIDFCPETEDKVSVAYDKVAHRYDTLLLRPSVPQRILHTLVWGIGNDRPYIETVLSYLPDQFDGILLDVPVGTGIFTSSIYTKYPKATIIGIDLSMSMLRKARECFERDGQRNVADVTNLPLRNNVVDLVISMNGWHAFADKQRTIAEIRRVLCTQGMLVACGYVKGARKISDWFVKHFGVPRGFFNLPFFGLDDVPSQFKGFKIIRQANVKSMAYFEAINEE